MQHSGGSRGARLAGYLAALIAAALAAGFASFLPAILAGETVLWSAQWAPSLGVGLSFMVDGLSLTFALLISGIGALILLYSVGYLGDHPEFGRFVLFLFAFMLSMLGLVLARDLITIFVFWELTSVTSYLLIGFNNEEASARRSALQAMLVTGAGGLALLAGFILIGNVAGGFDLATILAGEGVQDSGVYGVILTLVLLGAFTKSAQVPFHFWLPNAMAAPTPVSAYLHSATMVKAGIYLLARLHPVLGGTTAWTVCLTAAGLVTAVMASVLALRQTDLKQMLAYTTLMALGTITLFLAGDNPYALTAAMTFLIVHSLYKAALFMVVGAIDHGTGTRDTRLLGGLARAMPVTAGAAALAGLSMAGLPPTIGWIGKELLYAGGATLSPAGIILSGALLANALMVAVAGVVGLRPFFGAAGNMPHAAHEAPWQMLAGPAVLGLLGLCLGLGAHGLLQPMVDRILTGSLQAERAAGLHLWAGVNLPFLLSLATFALGLGLFLGRGPYRRAVAVLIGVLPSFDTGWDNLLDAFRAFAARLTRNIQTGSLTRYLTVVMLTLLIAVGGTFIARMPGLRIDLAAPPLLWIIAAFTAAGVGLAIFTGSRIAAIAGLGTVGIGVALIFILFGAPDVAITQLMVETLVAVLFGTAALRLPGMTDGRATGRKRRHGMIAIGIGVLFTCIILGVTSGPLDRHITSYFEEYSYSIAHGLNIVNVILVDFRALDTFGEITVVLIASIGAFALLKRRAPGSPE